jgi:L-serine deaminase
LAKRIEQRENSGRGRWYVNTHGQQQCNQRGEETTAGGRIVTGLVCGAAADGALRASSHKIDLIEGGW